MTEIYDHPEYFEIAYSFRDIRAEVDAIERLIYRYSQIPVKRILELGCGSAPHLPELARRGYHYVGLDYSASMLDAARRRAEQYRVRATFVQSDLADFALAKPVDFAMVLLGSLYVVTTAELTRHFENVARALHPGGLYLLDWTINCAPSTATHDIWVQRRGDIEVKTTYRAHLVSPVEQIMEEDVTMEVNDAGTRHVLHQVAHQREIYPQEFLAFVKHQPSWDFIGWWDSWDLDRPLDDLGAVHRPVVVIRRTGA
ncbi:MAG: class I SAM-dependent methyltransferase [Anaerolineae bacterium]